MIGSTSLCSAKRDNFCEKNKSAETDTSANKLNSRKTLYYYYYRKKWHGCKGLNMYFIKNSSFFHWKFDKIYEKRIKQKEHPGQSALLY